ncbi:hypothetical protein T484DRAFT_3046532 [Baffinella frigidus]|nr:hypothetical protein T484DRAFT_3046532 [Cryptophyta sp. CCMP2293]
MFACKPAAICKGPVTSQTNWRPEWQPDKSTKVCSTCSKGFNVLMRRHHCRHCGRVICGSCGKKKHRCALLKYGYQEPVRVCVSCHETCTQSEELMTAISANGYVACESLLDAGTTPDLKTTY